MSVQAYLNFNGNAREAVEFYAEVFSTDKPKIMSFGDMPSNGTVIGDDVKNLVLHAEIVINKTTIMFSDIMPGMPFTVGNNINLIYNGNDIEKMNTIFNKLKSGGNVQMELQETFWSKCYGFVTDKYGIGWMISLAE